VAEWAAQAQLKLPEARIILLEALRTIQVLSLPEMSLAVWEATVEQVKLAADGRSGEAPVAVDAVTTDYSAQRKAARQGTVEAAARLADQSARPITVGNTVLAAALVVTTIKSICPLAGRLRAVQTGQQAALAALVLVT
jgi:hypothetical protein